MSPTIRGVVAPARSRISEMRGRLLPVSSVDVPVQPDLLHEQAPPVVAHDAVAEDLLWIRNHKAAFANKKS
jgi:hypothetical protein